MNLSLHAATVPQFRQQLGGMRGLLAKAQTFCAETGTDPDAILQARLVDDMYPFAYQVKATALYSMGAIEGVRSGTFRPFPGELPASFEQASAAIEEALDGLGSATPEEMAGFMGRDMRFEVRDLRIDFAAEDFLLSFALPNFFFHATTAYALLRRAGVAIGKRDYLGAIRARPPAA